jgi:hypothetical protein
MWCYYANEELKKVAVKQENFGISNIVFYLDLGSAWFKFQPGH